MSNVPHEILSRFDTQLAREPIDDRIHPFYRKWLRFYFDFCHKYCFDVYKRDSLPPFLRKLADKKQSGQLRKQAEHAISIFYELAQSGESPKSPSPEPVPRSFPEKDDSQASARNRISPYAGQETGAGEDLRDAKASTPKTSEPSPPRLDTKLKRTNADWRPVFAALKGEISLRHYSPKTLRSYSGWVGKLQAFTRSKDPQLLTVADVKDFLTFLALERKVSASSQNQAFNALLFFFRHVLKTEFGEIKDVPRAKRKPNIPVVLSRQEIDSIIAALPPPYDLVVKLLYGCGLRLFEGVKLRVQDFNFDAMILTVHDGKGKKDRTVPLPEKIAPKLQAQIEKVIAQHEKDLATGYAGAFLENSLDQKYKNAAKELGWQWFFPAKTLTFVAEEKGYRRYHLHETHVQKAIRQAVKKAGTIKRATAHTFRHSYASHLLEAGYDIRTIQELLGHSDVRTTMIYTHTVKSRTLKEKKSPLDF